MRIKRHLRWMILGAAGTILAALIYLAALSVRGILSFLLVVPNSSRILFVILFVISLLEVLVMIVGLRQLLSSGVSLVLFRSLGVIYVAFAGVYAALLLLFVREQGGAQLLLSLALVRWGSLWWILPGEREKAIST